MTTRELSDLLKAGIIIMVIGLLIGIVGRVSRPTYEEQERWRMAAIDKPTLVTPAEAEGVWLAVKSDPIPGTGLYRVICTRRRREERKVLLAGIATEPIKASTPVMATYINHVSNEIGFRREILLIQPISQAPR